MLKLIKVIKSPVAGKKYRAIFNVGGYEKHTDFGATGYSDYTTHHDKKRRERYLTRHRSRENWNDFTSAGALSRWLLWNKLTLNESIRSFRRRIQSRS